MLKQSQEASCKKDTVTSDISTIDNNDDINSLRANAILGGATGIPYFKRTVTKFLFFKTLLFAGVLVLEAKESFVICRALNSLKSKIVILLGYLGAGFY